jgi:hypothetical protein
MATVLAWVAIGLAAIALGMVAARFYGAARAAAALLESEDE